MKKLFEEGTCRTNGFPGRFTARHSVWSLTDVSMRLAPAMTTSHTAPAVVRRGSRSATPGSCGRDVGVDHFCPSSVQFAIEERFISQITVFAQRKHESPKLPSL